MPPSRRTATTPAARATVAVGRARINASALKGLRAAWRERRLVLFLGAGVSIPYGLPSWRDLVLELLFEQAQQTRRLGPLWPHYRRAVASWMADYFSYDPLVLARVVERHLRPGNGQPSAPDEQVFLRRLRSHLYTNVRRPKERTLLRAVAELAGRRGGGLDSVVSFNFDDLFEAELTRMKVPFSTVAGPARQDGNGLRVIHAHGYLPRQGPVARRDVVFTEPDYHRLTESVFHWSLSEIVDRLRKGTVLFIGLSMSDPSLRRLLDASRNSDIPPHYQLQKRHEVRDSELLAAMQEIERRARRNAEILGTGFDEMKRPQELEDAVHQALGQADTYDREVFESMGVKTIWVDGFDEMPDVVDAISGR
jgi:hypothetical protein